MKCQLSKQSVPQLLSCSGFPLHPLLQPLPKTCPSPTPTPAPTSPAEQANPLVPQDTLGALPPAYTPPTPPPVSTLSSTFPLSQSDIAIKAFDSQQSAPVPAASQANASISDQSSGKALTLQGASAPSLSRQDAEIADSNVMQTSASGAGLDKASTATDDWSTQLHEGVTQLSHATEAEKAHGDGNTTDAAEMILHPAADTMASPAAKAAQTEDSAQIGPQLPISGAVAGNQPAMPSQALHLQPRSGTILTVLRPHRLASRQIALSHQICLLCR